MEQRIDYMVLLFLLICLSTTSEGRKYLKHSKRLLQHKTVNHLVTFETSESNNYIGSPNYLPPYEDVMSPTSSPNKQNPPYCILPPLTPMTPSPILPIHSSPPPPFISISPPTLTPNTPQNPTPSPPLFEPSPPSYEPSPPEFGPSPPSYEPSPPEYGPTPPSYVPGPPEFVPGPPMFLPPVVYPPPTAPPPPHTGTGPGLWCVVKPTVPDPIIQEAMNYACGSGADCDSIQPNGKCYQPDTLIAHASFAFNSYWQRTKVAGGNCDFGGTAMLITKDPSYDGCHFNLS